MRLFTRLIVCAAAAMVLSAVFFHLADAWFGENTSILKAGRQIVLEARRSQALRARTEMVTRCLDIKREIITELIAGRLSFRQAIVQFQKANELVENFDLDLIPAYRSPTSPEDVARQVYLWARNSVSTWPPEKSQHLLAGFESDFHRLFGRSRIEAEFDVRTMDTHLGGRSEANSPIW
jgi:hypothetical protein